MSATVPATMEPMSTAYAPQVGFLAPAAMRGVIDRQVQIGIVEYEVGNDQIEHDQPDLVDRPTVGGEEPVRPIMRPGPGQSGPGEHPAHRALAGPREQPDDHPGLVELR